MQRKGHLLVFEIGLQRDLLICRKARQKITDLRPTVYQQARRDIPLVQLRVVLHGPDEIQLILGEKGVALHTMLEKLRA
jgi:hypothetical protein